MSDKSSFDSKTEKHAGTEIGSLADLGLGLIDSAIAKPYNATIGLIAPKIDLSDDYNHESIAAKVGDFGGGIADVLALSKVAGLGVGKGLGWGVERGLISTSLAESSALASTLTLGTTGALYAGVFTGGSASERFKNASVGLATFGTLGASTAGLSRFGFLGEAGSRTFLQNIALGGLSGVPAGIANAEATSLANGHGLSFNAGTVGKSALYYGLFGATMSGVAHGLTEGGARARSWFSQDSAKPGSQAQFETAPTGQAADAVAPARPAQTVDARSASSAGAEAATARAGRDLDIAAKVEVVQPKNIYTRDWGKVDLTKGESISTGSLGPCVAVVSEDGAMGHLDPNGGRQQADNFVDWLKENSAGSVALVGGMDGPAGFTPVADRFASSSDLVDYLKSELEGAGFQINEVDLYGERTRNVTLDASGRLDVRDSKDQNYHKSFSFARQKEVNSVTSAPETGNIELGRLMQETPPADQIQLVQEVIARRPQVPMGSWMRLIEPENMPQFLRAADQMYPDTALRNAGYLIETQNLRPPTADSPAIDFAAWQRALATVQSEKLMPTQASPSEVAPELGKTAAKPFAIDDVTMSVKNPDLLKQAIANNAESELGTKVLNFANSWATIMEQKIAAGEPLTPQMAEQASQQTGLDVRNYEYDIARTVLVDTWQHGAELDRAVPVATLPESTAAAGTADGALRKLVLTPEQQGEVNNFGSMLQTVANSRADAISMVREMAPENIDATVRIGLLEHLLESQAFLRQMGVDSAESGQSVVQSMKNVPIEEIPRFVHYADQFHHDSFPDSVMSRMDQAVANGDIPPGTQPAWIDALSAKVRRVFPGTPESDWAISSLK